MKPLELNTAGVRTNPTMLIGGAVWTLLYLFFYGFFYGPLVPALVRDWYEHENFSYGFLIPCIVAYLVWQEREKLRQLPVRLTPAGGFSLLASVTIGLIGKITGDELTMRVSMVLTLGALVHLLLGKNYLKVLLFPLAYLLLMIPPPYIIVKEVSYYLRIFDAQAATYIVQAIGIPIYRDAHFLHLPNITLEVADVCSGIASLFAMFALGIVYAYYLPVRLGGKLVLMLGTVIFPLVANLIRIVLVSVSVYYYGPVMLGVFFHHFTGTFTFLLSLAMLLGLGEFLRRGAPEPVAKGPVRHEMRSGAGLVVESGHSGFQRQRIWVALLPALLIFLLGFYAWSLLKDSKTVALKNELQTLPSRLGSFSLSKGELPDRYNDPGAESFLSRVYSNAADKQIEVYVGYRSYQRGEKRLLSPKLYFPGKVQGEWEYIWIESERLVSPGFEAIDANWIMTQKAEAKRLVLYWYQVRGEAFAADLRYRYELLRNLLLDGRTEGAVIRITTPVSEDENADQAKTRIKEIALNIYPKLKEILPR